MAIIAVVAKFVTNGGRAELRRRSFFEAVAEAAHSGSKWLKPAKNELT
jgi:hypothetical protein